MPDELDLRDHDRDVLQAVSAVEMRDGTATIATIARETGLGTDDVEDATSRLTDLDLIRERRVEQDAEAVGAGREYTVRARG